MILHDEIATLRAVIARREAERDAMRASGRQEKYLAAYRVVDSLEQRLEQLRQEGLRNSRMNDARAPLYAPGVSRAVIMEMDGDSSGGLPKSAA